MQLDHIAVAGATLEDATEHVEAALGVKLQPGGHHDKFGTYNTLLGLANGLYLEAIAIDPESPDPGRPRWFDLDRFSGAPRLTNWICHVTDMNAILARMPDTVGMPMWLSRGELRWKMAVPESGALPFDNLFPALIEWQGNLHPSGMLTQSGCTLRRLTVSHPLADDLSGLLGPLKWVNIEPGDPGLKAKFDTPHGMRILE